MSFRQRLTYVAAVLALAAGCVATSPKPDQEEEVDWTPPEHYDPTCELNWNGISFLDNGNPYVCNMDLDHFPFNRPNTDWNQVQVVPLKVFEDGSYLAYLTYEGETYKLGACGKPSWGCTPDWYNPDPSDPVPTPEDIRDTALDYLGD